MDDQTPAETVDATAQTQMDDQTPTEPATNTDQASTDPAKATAQAHMNDLEHAFAEQMTVASIDPVNSAHVQRLQDLQKKASQYSAIAPQLRKDATRVAYIEHMLGPDFPTELLSSVLETAIRSTRLRWRPSGSDSFDAVVDKFFVWPATLDENTRENIREKAGTALLKEAIIELPAEFTLTSDAPILVIPPALLGREQRIHRLVLDIKLNTRDGGYQTQLNRVSHGMHMLFSRLPKLRTIVVSLHIGTNRPQHTYGSFNAGILALRNQISYTEIEDLQTSLTKFIDILHTNNIVHKKGPDLRKFVRFVDQRSDDFFQFGPLVRVPNFVESQAPEAPGKGDAPSRAIGGPLVGEQVLEQAYRYHRDPYRSSERAKSKWAP